MPGLLIKNLPAELHQLLKSRASKNHRSLTKEAISILEAALTADETKPTLEQLDRRRVHGKKSLTDAIIRQAKTTGRP